MTILILFYYLQLLDLLTTQLAILHGVREANPLVRAMIHFAPTPIMGLVWVKLIAAVYGVYCFYTDRLRYLVICNWWFAVVPVWNLAVLIAGGVK